MWLPRFGKGLRSAAAPMPLSWRRSWRWPPSRPNAQQSKRCWPPSSPRLTARKRSTGNGKRKRCASPRPADRIGPRLHPAAGGEAMIGYLNQALFGIYPYVALSVFLIGSVVRFDREQYTWRSGSSQLLRRRLLFVGSNCFHIGVLAILAGHFVGLLTPHEVYTALGLSVANKQLMAVG